MSFRGLVWRHVPHGAHPLDFSALIHAGGRWNRPGLYGCLYTALTAEGAAAEYRKHLIRRGLDRPRDLVCLEVEVRYVLDLPAVLASGKGTIAHPKRTGRSAVLPRIDERRLTGDDDGDLEHCRAIADWARQHDFLAIKAPSAALRGEITLPIYPENRPADLKIEVHSGPMPLNHGPDPFLDAEGRHRR